MKGLHELKINEALENVMPPLQEMELSLLTKSLMEEGCRDPLVVWKETGALVDGHNRYRICQENGIPFEYVEMSFDSETQAKMWIIRNQLARRNVPDFVRCELVLPLEEELKAEAKKRQGQRNDLQNIPPNLAGSCGNGDSRDSLARMAGVSHGNLSKAKKIIAEADEETKEKLRAGDLSIHGAYTALKDNGAAVGKNHPRDQDEILPGHTTEQILGREKMGYKRPPDSVYDIPAIHSYGNMPAEDQELRGRAEMEQAKSSLRTEMVDHVRRVSDILRAMSSASINEGNINNLKQIVTTENNKIMEKLEQMLQAARTAREES